MVHLAVEQGIDSFLNYGALGAIVVLLVTGLLVAKPIYTTERDRADRAEQRLETFTKDVMEKVNPLLERAIQVINARADFEHEISDVLKDVRRLLEQGH